MQQQSTQQINKILMVYQHHFLKTQQTLTLKKQSLEEVKQRLDGKLQTICQIETRLAQTQNSLIASGQLSQWQVYQYHSKAQRELIGQLTSQKSKLEIEVAFAQMEIEKTLKKLHVIRHKCDIMKKLEKHIKHVKIIKTNESDDESCAEQWQLTRPVLTL